MFFTYLWKEIARRRKQTFVVALGLALGIALVISVSAMAAGVKDAQGTVLSSLYGVGTDLTVTQTADQGDGGSGGPGFEVDQGGAQGFSRDRVLTNPGQATFRQSRVDDIAAMDGVGSATGGLSLTATHIKGKLPEFPTDGGTVIAPGDTGQGQDPGQGTGPQTAQINVSTFSLLGLEVDAAGTALPSSQIAAGRSLRASDADATVAVVDESFAADRDLAVGDTLRVGDRRFEVVGIATATSTGTGSDVYVPLDAAQDLAREHGKVNSISVQASSATQIDQVDEEIRAAYPDATVTTADDLASQVSGSLSSASNLLTRLGTWLSIAVVGAAVALASLLTLSAVGRRTQELGTLKALGWRTRRVVGQVMGESLVQGALGGVLGVALGLASAVAIAAFAPSLTATVSTLGAGATSFAGGPGLAGGGDDPFTRTIDLALTAPVSVQLVVLAFGLAVAGGVIAGCVGGWRAARLRPADAMRVVA
jgi:ABC-type antimicrobial peptide transport system permease subunit